MDSTVLIVSTGLANVASVRAGLARAGATSAIVSRPEDIVEAPGVLLPGVGAFGPAMEALEDRGFADPLRERVRAGRPTMAICLGLQLLFTASEENPGVTGLGIIDGTARRFAEGQVVPHMGWNEVSPTAGCRLLAGGFAYFANSYFVDTLPPGWEAATTTYGSRFVAGLERGSVLACQFHPELSGGFGQRLMERWLESVGSKGAPC